MNSKKDLVMVQVRVPKKNHNELKKLSFELGLSMNGIVNFAISQYLQQRDLPNQIAELSKVVNNTNIAIDKVSKIKK